jgi:hypothetical protein
MSYVDRVVARIRPVDAGRGVLWLVGLPFFLVGAAAGAVAWVSLFCFGVAREGYSSVMARGDA